MKFLFEREVLKNILAEVVVSSLLKNNKIMPIKLPNSSKTISVKNTELRFSGFDLDINRVVAVLAPRLDTGPRIPSIFCKLPNATKPGGPYERATNLVRSNTKRALKKFPSESRLIDIEIYLCRRLTIKHHRNL